MDGFLRVDNQNLPSSPSNSFLADEVASICPLITPSPPTNDLINPPPEPTEPNFEIGKQLANKLQQVQDEDKAADSASSSSSAIAEPACTQLLNHRNVYHHISQKNEDTETQETNGKTQVLQLTFKNPPDDYFFMTWNWPLIRKVSLYTFLSCLVAMVAIVIAMIYSLPKTCNPPTQWYQGNLMYEIFPASFYTENGMEGDFKGLSKKADYIQQLGVRTVRLNSIFHSPHYPTDFENVTSLVDIAPGLGNLTDFQKMTKYFQGRNISIVLDLPLYPFIKKLPVGNSGQNNSQNYLVLNEQGKVVDPVEQALAHWVANHVEGFYLKGLEHFVEDPELPHAMRRWKKILGPDRIFIVHEKVINTVPKNILKIVLNNIDLVDVKLEIEKGVEHVKDQISLLENGTLFTERGAPWVHWSLGNVNSNRLANILPFGNATLGATLLQMMLPGTPSIFYGDEIGLQEIIDPDGERQDLKHLHHLGMMEWKDQKPSNLKVLPWIYGEKGSPIFDQIEIIKKMTAIRKESPAIYMNSVYKEGEFNLFRW